MQAQKPGCDWFGRNEVPDQSPTSLQPHRDRSGTLLRPLRSVKIVSRGEVAERLQCMSDWGLKEVVYHRGEQLRIRKSLKLYIVLYRNAMKNIKSRWIRFGTHIHPWYQKIWCFLYSINANFHSNVLVEQMIKYWGRMHDVSLNVLKQLCTQETQFYVRNSKCLVLSLSDCLTPHTTIFQLYIDVQAEWNAQDLDYTR